MPLFESRVVATVPVACDYYRLDFTWPKAAARPEPGQFITIRVADASAPLLRRPFGISGFVDADLAPARSNRAPSGSEPDVAARPTDAIASMIYWRRGEATRLLAGYSPGDRLDVMGPLGVGFPLPATDAVPVLVAGGVGIGPILFFANALAAAGSAPLLLIGARETAGLPEIDVDRRVQVRLATDDGSTGFAGNAVALLDQTIEVTAGELVVYLCGPDPMLRAGHECAERHGLRAWVSMEQTMGCAVGACMGCAVRVTGPARYARVCTEGPVFASTEIVWE